LVIDAFLCGQRLGHEDSALQSEDGKLWMHGAAIAHYDTAGALVVAFPTDGTTAFYVETIANHMAEAIGLEARVTREDLDSFDLEGASQYAWRWRYEDQYIKPNEPIVLCGRLGVASYRAVHADKLRKG
jgi:hypothetical protein